MFIDIDSVGEYNRVMPKKNRRPQKVKSRSYVALDAIFHTGAGSHKNKKDYRRKPKHPNRVEED